MCGVIGFSSDKVTQTDLNTLKNVLIESRIRGMHASGVAWYDGHTIRSKSQPIPIDKFLEGFQLREMVYSGQRIAMISHTRYSTSDLAYNQPLLGGQLALAHNGVISQADPATWKATYGYDCKTRNDSELLLKALKAGDDPFKKFPGASIAAVTVDNQGYVQCIRNGLRPLWKGRIGHGVVYGSTLAILQRAGVTDIEKVACNDNDSQRRDWTNHGVRTTQQRIPILRLLPEQSGC